MSDSDFTIPISHTPESNTELGNHQGYKILRSGDLLWERYHIVRELGSGGFATTYLAIDRKSKTSTKCVVKQLQPRFNSPTVWANAKDRLATEATVLQWLGNHDRIPQLLAHFEEERQFYLVLEFIEGEELEQEVQKQVLNEHQVIEFLIEVLKILNFVHQQGLIHRDIKPSNLIRRRKDGKFTLIDFGAVKEIGTLSFDSHRKPIETQIIGTPGYMPPEQQNGKPIYSSDLYALGKTAIYALTGRSPIEWETTETSDVVNWHDAIDISKALVTVIERMTAAKIADRYHSASKVIQDLKPMLAVGKSVAGRYYIKEFLSGRERVYSYVVRSLEPDNPSLYQLQILRSPSTTTNLTSAVERINSEIFNFAKLKHLERVPKIIEYLTDDKNLYLIKEYVEGESLERSIARQKKFTEVEIIDLIIDAAEILAEVHQQNIIHGNIAPSSLVKRSSDGKLILVNFGSIQEAVDSSSGDGRTPRRNRDETLPRHQQNNSRVFRSSNVRELSSEYSQVTENRHRRWQQSPDSNRHVAERTQRQRSLITYFDINAWRRKWFGDESGKFATSSKNTNHKQQDFADSAKHQREAFEATSDDRHHPVENGGKLQPLPFPSNATDGNSAASNRTLAPELSDADIFSSSIEDTNVDSADTVASGIDREEGLPVVTVGQTDYIPPEQIAGSKVFASDIYGLGMTAIHLLTGVSPPNLPKNPRTGEILWQKQATVDPKLAEILNKMVCLDKRKRYQSATKLIRDLNKLEPKSSFKSWLKYLLIMTALSGVVWFVLVQWAQRVAILEFYKGDIKLEAKRYREAIEYYDNGLEKLLKTRGIVRNFEQVWLKKARALNQLNSYEEMSDTCSNALQYYQSHRLWNCKALALDSLKEYEAALDAYDRALALDMSSPWVWNNRGEVYAQIGDTEAAIADFQRAIELDVEKSFVPWNNLGKLHYQQRDYERAVEAYQQALLVKEDYLPALIGMGNARKNQGQYAEALQAYNKAIELDGNSYEAWYGKGLVEESLQQYREAKKAYQTAFSLKPDWETVIKALQRVERKIDF